MNALSKLIRATTTLRHDRRAANRRAGAALLLSFATSLACGGLDDSGLTSSIGNALCRGGGCLGDDSGAPEASGSACRSDVDCAVGLECEVEHGAGFCKPHGGDRDNSSDNGSAGSAGSANNSAGSARSDETFTTPPCEEDEDCAADERCESIGHSQRTCFADNDSGRSGSGRSGSE